MKKDNYYPQNKKRNRLCGYECERDYDDHDNVYHTSPTKNFKYFYKTCIEYIHKNDFSNALSYNRFVELTPRLFIPFNIVLHMLFGEESRNLSCNVLL